MSRILAIGDIHGTLDKLRMLLAGIKWDPDEDTLIFIGDYVDRGPDSAGVIDHLIGLRQWSDKVVCLRGNHEQMFLDFLEGRNEQTFNYNGGQATIESYGGIEAGIPEEHVEFLNSLPLYYETNEYIFVHAGLKDAVPLDRQDYRDMMWIREEFIYSDYDFGKMVVFGHTPMRKPLVLANKIGIDTGAVYGGHLTCLEIPGRVFHSA
ncbi:MAG: serine/threonine protein phosphatase [Deltaproteobacteria bacterium]|nr:serine/threonine protein phosphatase [Deltaproteobacteria bacterium]